MSVLAQQARNSARNGARVVYDFEKLSLRISVQKTQCRICNVLLSECGCHLATCPGDVSMARSVTLALVAP